MATVYNELSRISWLKNFRVLQKTFWASNLSQNWEEMAESIATTTLSALNFGNQSNDTNSSLMADQSDFSTEVSVFDIVVIVIRVIVTIIGLLANAMVIYVVYRFSDMRTYSNIFCARNGFWNGINFRIFFSKKNQIAQVFFPKHQNHSSLTMTHKSLI